MTEEDCQSLAMLQRHICIHTYVHIYIDIAYIYTYVYTRVCIHICFLVCVYTYTGVEAQKIVITMLKYIWGI